MQIYEVDGQTPKTIDANFSADETRHLQTLRFGEKCTLEGFENVYIF